MENRFRLNMPYGTVQGHPTIRYEQNGNYFDKHFDVIETTEKVDLVIEQIDLHGRNVWRIKK